MEQFYQILTFVGLFAYWLIAAGVAIRVIIKRRSIGVSLAWMMVIYFVPFFGVIGYLLIGEQNWGKARENRAKLMYAPYREWFADLFKFRQYQPKELSQYGHSISALCENRLGIPSLGNNQLELQTTPQEILNSMISDINNAQSSINLEFYIWHPGGLADNVAQALIDAANRGVDVKLLLDAAGSRQFFKSHWPKQLRKNGIEVTNALLVSPLRMFFRRLDLRMHRKIVIIDNCIGYTGSMNMVDPAFFKQNAHVGQWIDVMVRLTGSNVPVLNTINSWDWEVETNHRHLPEAPKCISLDADNPVDILQVIPSGPGMPTEIIHQVLLLSIYQAKSEIVITTPYFVPSEGLMFALVSAAHRGVNVELIIPYRNDSTMVKWASRSFFSELLSAGVKIYRFKGGLLHTKSVVIDQNHCLIGTVNLDMRSLWLNSEVTLAVDDVAFTQKLGKLQQSYIDDSVQVDHQVWRKRPVYKRVIEQFFYMFSPLL
ncbi:cardiolipin synthase A [Shewanella hanedai]|uniref:Cardiolipin synthase A n=1 Tax=Shewanella hanedai TaxID=25 RepID=A0A553JRN0_SHEHA|nr:cardiolipin synthase [Shewanella hanedai]TRY15126.1 cardiolipin synthase [Shewanella hanedai]GGI74478.1 cardiolipin synthase A [Shewanella hanedai]